MQFSQEFVKSSVTYKANLLLFLLKNLRSFCTAKAAHIYSAKNGCTFVYNTFANIACRWRMMTLVFNHLALYYKTVLANLS